MNWWIIIVPREKYVKEILIPNNSFHQIRDKLSLIALTRSRYIHTRASKYNPLKSWFLEDYQNVKRKKKTKGLCLLTKVLSLPFDIKC